MVLEGLTTTPAFLPLVIMAVVGPLGALDVVYFHIWKFRLHARPASRAETVTHLARGLLVSFAVFVLAHYEPRGGWLLVVAAAMVADVLNNIADVVLEPASRAALGGLPRAESVIHIVGATAGGAFAAVYLVLAARLGLAAEPTALTRVNGLPDWLVWNANAIAAGGVALVLFEGGLLVHAVVRGMPVRDGAT